MELKEFIKTTLQSISEAISDSNLQNRIVEYDTERKRDIIKDHWFQYQLKKSSSIDFEVVVDTSESTDYKGGVTIKVFSFDSTKKLDDSKTTQIKFSISLTPDNYPIGPTISDKNEKV